MTHAHERLLGRVHRGYEQPLYMHLLLAILGSRIFHDGHLAFASSSDAHILIYRAATIPLDKFAFTYRSPPLVANHKCVISSSLSFVKYILFVQRDTELLLFYHG